MEKIFKPEIDCSSFKVDYYLDRKYLGEIDEENFGYPFLPAKKRNKLKRIGQFKLAITKWTIYVYVDEEDNLWYKNTHLISGEEYDKDDDKVHFWVMAGWSEISGAKKYLEKGYTPLQVKSALALYLLEKEKDNSLSQAYEDLLLESLTVYKNYLDKRGAK